MNEIIYNNNIFRSFNATNINRLVNAKTKFNLEFLSKKYDLNPSRTFVDCGASVGIEALPLHALFKEIHCFEPSPVQYKLLSDNVSSYKNIFLYNCALNDRKGKTYLFQYQGNLNSSNLAIMGKRNLKNARRILVGMEKLDDYNFQQLDFLKIDVEESEKYLLLGAQKTLEQNNPIIKIEMSKNQNEVVAFLKALNYRPVAFDCDGTIYEITDDLTFTEFEDMMLWSSRNITLDWKIHERESKRGFVFPDEMNPCWGDFWFIKQ